ncbi:helix-turn-helix domain-containing protein [Brevibacillus porteri]|uniref:helix-turn-helix domain-containing protein n=1 Tax=Brevibacillus porteri TaxID=2126350 RepID=UPI003D23A68B
MADQKSADFLDVLVQQITQDERLIEKLIPRLVERLGGISQKPDQWLSVNEAAEYLGVSTYTIYAMVREGSLKASRLGQLQSRKPSIRFKKSALDAWMDNGGVREQTVGNS